MVFKRVFPFPEEKGGAKREFLRKELGEQEGGGCSQDVKKCKEILKKIYWRKK